MLSCPNSNFEDLLLSCVLGLYHLHCDASMTLGSARPSSAGASDPLHESEDLGKKHEVNGAKGSAATQQQ